MRTTSLAWRAALTPQVAKATTIPKTMLNWNMAVSLPRISCGAISAMYMGATTEEAPTARPPIKPATEPTDKSMWPATMISSMPSAMMTM